ncbi:MAG: ABC transporter substrate-binding protein [bacterium]
MLTRRSRKNIVRFCFTAGVMYLLNLNILIAQESNHPDNRRLVIGDLMGRTDMREMKILTQFGDIPIFGGGNNKPFKIINRSPDELELQFNRSPGLRVANPHRIVYKFYESERALISALILDEVDFAELENEVSAAEVSRSNHHFLPLPQTMIPNTVKLICYNHRKQILKSRDVRVALAYAINHDYIRKKIILGGKANIARGPFDNDSPLYNPGMESYKYNPKMAIRLLQQAGWRDSNRDGILEKAGVPFRINLFFQKGLSLDEAISRQIKINLIKIGVDVQPKPVSKSEINNRLATSDFDAVLMDHTFENNIQSLAEFFSANGLKNYMGYRSNTFENYLKFYNQIDDAGKKVTFIKSMQGVINKDQPVNFLYFKWLTHYMVNINKIANYRDTAGQETKGKLRPFEQWIIKNLVEE